MNRIEKLIAELLIDLVFSPHSPLTKEVADQALRGISIPLLPKRCKFADLTNYPNFPLAKGCQSEGLTRYHEL